MPQIEQTKFKSAILGAVAHPKNVLREYLTAFKNKCQADILSFVDGWIKTNRAKQKPDWVRLSASYLADNLGYCKKTVKTHLNKLVEMGVLVRDTLIKLYPCDTAYSYKINEAVLLGIVEKKQSSSGVNLPLWQGKFTPLEEQNYLAYYINPDKKEINTTTSACVVANKTSFEYQEVVEPYSVCSKVASKQVEVEPTGIEHTSPAVPNERIQEIEALGVQLSSELRIAVLTAAASVLKNAVAVFKASKAAGKVKCPTAYLLSAIRKQWQLPVEQVVKSKIDSFIAWRQASKANDAAAKFSVTKGDRIEISADGKIWTTWEVQP